MERQYQPEDIFITGEGYLGAQTVARQNGREIARLANGDWDTFEAAIGAWCYLNGFFPEVWLVSDHGNLEALTLEVLQ